MKEKQILEAEILCFQKTIVKSQREIYDNCEDFVLDGDI